MRNLCVCVTGSQKVGVVCALVIVCVPVMPRHNSRCALIRLRFACEWCWTTAVLLTVCFYSLSAHKCIYIYGCSAVRMMKIVQTNGKKWRKERQKHIKVRDINCSCKCLSVFALYLRFAGRSFVFLATRQWFAFRLPLMVNISYIFWLLCWVSYCCRNMLHECVGVVCTFAIYTYLNLIIFGAKIVNIYRQEIFYIGYL